MTFELASIVRSSLVLAIGFFIVTALRRQPASFRHAILAAAIVLAALQPLASLVVPSWNLPGSWTTAPVTLPVDAPRILTATSFELIVPAAQPAAALSPAVIALWVWAAGVAVSLAGMVFAAVWLTWLAGRGRDAGGDWCAIARELSMARTVRLRITTHPAMLATWGVIRPIVLLPSEAETWSADRIRVVLAHELAHVRRRDWVVHVIAELARAINWFNPLFWIACARLRRDSEHACDDIVLAHGISNTSYASHLVDLARTFRVHGRTWLPAPSMARPSTLERRIRTMLNPQARRRPLSVPSRALILGALVALALPIAAVSQGPATPSGVVTDPSGRVVPGVTVRLASTATEAVFEAQTDASGAYQFAQIPAGDYMLTARYPGFLSLRRRVTINAGTPALPIAMQVGTLRETISTTAGKDAVDGPRSEQRSQAPVSYQATACTPQETGGHIIPPMKIRDVRPRFKKSWIDSRTEGSILMQARIDVNGRVRELEVVSPVHPELEDEALGAVSQWEFTPTWLNCQPIEVRMFVTVTFSLEP
jgi:beta-lactamase regulating signal transducer with metallopeptidase domain